MTSDNELALNNCDAIQRVHPDLECVLETIRTALQRAEKVDGLVKALKEIIECRYPVDPEWTIKFRIDQALAEFEKVE